LDSRESILGLDNIRLELPVAGVGSRTLAAFLDYLLLGAILLVWTFAVGMFAVASAGSSWAIVALVAGWFVLEWGYFALSEILTGGRTLGKRAVRLRVITAEGGSPGAGALLARNLVRSLDLVLGIPMIAFDPLARRLGDRLAGTLVVHERRRAAVALLGRVPPGWGPREVAAVEAFLARSDGFEDSARLYELADRILGRLRQETPEFLADLDPREVRRDPVAALRKALQVEEG
jgi:uncharacterized RDD family membrane protein YckC